MTDASNDIDRQHKDSGQAGILPASYSAGRSIQGAQNTGAQSAGGLKRGADGLGILGHVMDGWDLGNRIVDKILQSGMAEQLGKYVEKGDAALAPAINGLGAASEISKGAPAGTTIVGAGVKIAADIGAGILGGAALGSALGPIGTVVGGIGGGLLSDRLLGNNNQSIGEGTLQAIDRAFLDRQ